MDRAGKVGWACLSLASAPIFHVARRALPCPAPSPPVVRFSRIQYASLATPRSIAGNPNYRPRKLCRHPQRTGPQTPTAGRAIHSLRTGSRRLLTDQTYFLFCRTRYPYLQRVKLGVVLLHSRDIDGHLQQIADAKFTVILRPSTRYHGPSPRYMGLWSVHQMYTRIHSEVEVLPPGLRLFLRDSCMCELQPKAKP